MAPGASLVSSLGSSPPERSAMNSCLSSPSMAMPMGAMKGLPMVIAVAVPPAAATRKTPISPAVAVAVLIALQEKGEPLALGTESSGRRYSPPEVAPLSIGLIAPMAMSGFMPMSMPEPPSGQPVERGAAAHSAMSGPARYQELLLMFILLG